MTCYECDPAFGVNLWHCHEASVAHDDGRTECLAGASCALPHHLHHWQITCSDLVPACCCATSARPAAPLARRLAA